MGSTTIIRLTALRAALLHYLDRTETEAVPSPGIALAVLTMTELSEDLTAVIESGTVPNDGETWRAAMASCVIASGYLAGAFLEKAKASGTSTEHPAFESQIQIGCSYMEAAVALIMAASVTGQESLVGVVGSGS